MTPIIQALVLADHIYEDKSGKKIIAGTFNQIRRKKIQVQGGTELGSPWLYLSLTDVVDETRLILQLVNRETNAVLRETVITIKNQDRLATVELVLPLPPLWRVLPAPGQYSYDVVSSEGEILGSHRLILEEF